MEFGCKLVCNLLGSWTT